MIKISKFYKIKFEPNKSYTIKLCSLEKKYVFYRNNFQRLCNENYKLKQENEDLKLEIEDLKLEIEELIESNDELNEELLNLMEE